jgi:hypothetical protein
MHGWGVGSTGNGINFSHRANDSELTMRQPFCCPDVLQTNHHLTVLASVVVSNRFSEIQLTPLAEDDVTDFIFSLPLHQQGQPINLNPPNHHSHKVEQASTAILMTCCFSNFHLKSTVYGWI